MSEEQDDPTSEALDDSADRLAEIEKKQAFFHRSVFQTIWINWALGVLLGWALTHAFRAWGWEWDW